VCSFEDINQFIPLKEYLIIFENKTYALLIGIRRNFGFIFTNKFYLRRLFDETN